MTSTQTTLNQNVSKACKHLTQLEERYYCNVFSAFLADEVLSSSCDLQEVSA